MIPWKTLDRAAIPGGGELTLVQRGAAMVANPLGFRRAGINVENRLANRAGAASAEAR